jgi:type I restriction enzyme S subunit
MTISGYAEYTESGIPWLGAIPSDWQLLPFFSRFSERKISNKGMKCNNLLSLSYGRIVNKDITTLDGLLPASFETYQIVHIDDIVFRLTDLQNDKKSLRSAIVSEKGIITSAYLAVVVHKFDAAFSSYLFRAYDLMKVFYSMGGGLRQSMKYDDMKWLMIAAPTVNEQAQIARFLDYETAKIDILIQEQKRLIDLLKEKRQAVISRAVTKGLDPDVPTKDSGVKWLGEIPAHWQLKRLKQVTSQIIDGAHFTPTYVDTGIPFIRVKDIQSTKINMEEIKRIPEDEHAELIKRCNPAKGDILLSKNGTIGLTKIVDWDFQFSIFVSLCLIKSTSEISSEFLEKVLSSDFASEQFRDLGQKTSVTNLHLEKIREMIVLLPTIAEQSRICSFVDVETAKLALLSTEALKGIALLKERRSALVSAAVTGKIDVRNWQPPADKSTFNEGARQAGLEAEA